MTSSLTAGVSAFTKNVVVAEAAAEGPALAPVLGPDLVRGPVLVPARGPGPVQDPEAAIRGQSPAPSLARGHAAPRKNAAKMTIARTTRPQMEKRIGRGRGQDPNRVPDLVLVQGQETKGQLPS